MVGLSALLPVGGGGATQRHQHQPTGYTLPSQLLPTTRSALLDSILAVSRKASPQSVLINQFNPTTTTSNTPTPPLEQLSWSGSTVTWSKGGATYRSFSFTQHHQPVIQALFAYWPPPAPPSTPTPQPSTSQTRLDDASTFGPFHPSPPPPWTDDPLALPTTPTPSQPTADPSLQRYLVVFLADVAYAYPPSGGAIPFQLPFHLKRAWPMDHGILLERAAEGDELFHPTSVAEMATLYSLLDPTDEIKVVSSTSSLANLFPSSSTTPPPPPTAEGPSLPFQDLSERLIFASDRTDGSEPLLVTSNAQQGKISVWAYARVPPSIIEEEAAAAPTSDKGKGKEREILSPSLSRHSHHPDRSNTSATTNTTTLNGSSKRKRPSFAGPSSHPPVSLGDRDRSQTSRRISISGVGGVGGGGVGSTSFGGAGGASQEADLLEALGEQMSRTTSAMSSSMNAADRRTSVTRNELSITMDRMALGQGSRDGLGLGTLGGEMDREATIFFANEGEERGMVSDVLCAKVWEIDLASAGSDVLTSATCHIFDTRPSSTASPSSTLSIHLPTSSTLLLLSISRTALGSLHLTPLQQLHATAHSTALVTRPNVLDLVFRTPEGGFAVVTAEGRTEELATPPLPPGRKVVNIQGDGSRDLLLTLDDGSRHLSTAPRLPEGVTRRCLEALSLVLPLDEFAGLQRDVRERRKGEVDWEAFGRVLEGLFGGEEGEKGEKDPYAVFLDSTSREAMADPLFATLRTSSSPSSTFSSPPPPSSAAPSNTHLQAIVWTLHLVAQDAKLEKTREGEWVQVARLVRRLSERMGLRYWSDAYRRSLGETARGDDSVPDTSPSTLLNRVPSDLLQSLHSLLRGVPETPPSLSQISATLSLTPSFFYGLIDPLSLTSQLYSLYSLLACPPSSLEKGPSTTLTRAQSTVRAIVAFGWDAARIDRLAVGVALPLREAIRMCQFDAPLEMSSKAFELIRRPDLARQTGGKEVMRRSGNKLQTPPKPLAIDAIIERTKNGVPVDDPPTTRSADEEMSTGPKAERFNEDRRLEEVTRMLQYSEPVTIASERTLDQLTPNVQQNLLGSLSNRTLALPIGFGMFTYRTRSKISSESVPIPRINTSARILPMPSPVAYIEKEPRDAPGGNQDRFEWPEFHSGVAAALQLQVHSTGFDSSQISFNKPAELDSKHAGFLMGLGLVGQISSMVFNQAFEYLKMKHDPTSIGLLLGLAVTYIGTGDPKVTSLISVHLAALHPPHSSPLNVSGITQAAGLVGIGLLYLGTQRRTLADIMIRELCSIKVTAIEDPPACREAYALSAGFAFGMIMLGSGKSAASTPGEVDLLRTFRALILGESNHPLPGATPSLNITDVNITSSAATMAVGLMYLRTERQDVADLLEIPDTARRLDYVRSDLLLLRTLARSIIRWETIQSSKAWVEGHVPRFIVESLEAKASKGQGLDADLDVARWNIIAGACFAIGLKFAGTATAEAHGTLIHFLDRLTRTAYVKAPTIQGKIKRDAIRCCLSVVAMALAMVMAGTGELNVLRRLRVAHGHFGEGVTYGTHLASHMALGLLLVGSGRYTLGTSNSAIAALLLAFYPAFPSSPSENRAHLQAYRHLWTLAIEPRCLEARDVDTNEPTFLPIRLRLAEKGSTELRAKQLVAPTLIPELRLINTIQVDTPRYWGFSLHLASNPAHLASFLKEGTLYVKRRTGHLSYAQDTRGIRSIFTKSKSETGSSVIDFGEAARILSPSAAGLKDFVSFFSEDVEAKAAVAQLTRPSMNGGGGDGSRKRPTTPPTSFEAFAASVLLECLTKDKRDTVAVYLALYHAHRLLSLPTLSPLALLALEQIEFILDFYGVGGPFSTLFSKPRSSSSSSKSSSPREALIQPTFLDHVSTTTTSLARSPLLSDPELAVALRSYLLYSTWPSTNPDVAARLSIYLVDSGAPDLPSLEKLRELVLSAKKRAEEAGMGSEEVETSVGLLMRGTKKIVESAGKKAWKGEFGEVAARVWLEVDV
ncbi:hypothetical protein BCR35DRAFT_310470 [Leucosporidium creatinivorum]|uniref:Uncharacterized protein n=1 Tax=Leucosporidium creatinivorum TaxID=106004 RepID=A0A1Y2D682_9BASI|nr:hypothetical protein BCR35DRAFT_310470 [Leucosporidium creatinivorum]